MQSHKILITGANGLVGRVTAEYLAEQGFQMVGIDKDKESQISARFHMTQDTENVILKRKFPGEFYVADITNENELQSIIDKTGKPDIVIHLAAALENQPAEVIYKVNVLGTENIFKMCFKNDIQRVIFSSSLILLRELCATTEPYRSIYNNTYTGMPHEITKIIEEYPFTLSVTEATDSVKAYTNSKLIAEDIARRWSSYGIASIAMRLGALTTRNQPPAHEMWAWCSHKDLCQFMLCAINYLSNKKGDFNEFTPLFVSSNNRLRFISLDKAKNKINFVPEDKAESVYQLRWSLNNTAEVSPTSKEQKTYTLTQS